jgi:hypothetical protein
MRGRFFVLTQLVAVVSPPLVHGSALRQVFGFVVDGADVATGVRQRGLNHVRMVTVFVKQR